MKLINRAYRISFRQLEFRTRVMLLVGVSFAIFAVVTATITPMVAGEVVAAREEQVGKEIATSFARQSELAVLYRSADNAKEAADKTRSFPGIVYVAVQDETGNSILSLGRYPNDWTPDSDVRGQLKGNAVYVYQNQKNWHFMVPVRVKASDDQIVLSPEREEVLGYVHVVRSKDSLGQLAAKLASSVILVTLLSLVFTLLVLLPTINRMIRPVRELSNRLSDASSNPTAVRISESGPPELVKMARAFNSLMELLADRDQRLREHSEQLEAEVRQRTKELEEARDLALSASRHKSEFLATVSHELRTPLQAILGYAQVAVKAARTQENRRLVDDLSVITQAAEQLHALIRDILDLSKIEAGRMDVVIEPVDLKALSQELIATAAPLAEKGGNTLQASLACDRYVVRTDRDKLRQIILNLLSNACKFAAGGKVRLQMVCDDSDRNVLRIRVTDTGRGIAKEHQEVIFEAFRQVNRDATHPGGAGLGLAITRRLCDLLKGEISVESKEGKGSTFTVTIPVDPM